MNIAINTVYKDQFLKQTDCFFIEELCNELIASNHSILIISSKAYESLFSWAKDLEDCQLLIVDKEFNSHLSVHVWNFMGLSKLINKLGNIDKLIHPFAQYSLRLSTPQSIIVEQRFIPQKQYFIKQYLEKATKTIVLSDDTKQQLLQQFPTIKKNKFVITPPAPFHQILPLEEAVLQNIRDTYSEGNAYFLFLGGNNEKHLLEEVLKAFSIFKKWQKSSMKLLIGGGFTTQKEDVISKLSSYKYKEDVVIIKEVNVELYIQLLAAAYAYIHPFSKEYQTLLLLSAMKSEVAVIASKIPCNEEIAKDHCLYCETTNLKETLATAIQQLYKDEKLRGRIIKSGLERVQKFSWKESTDSILSINE